MDFIRRIFSAPIHIPGLKAAEETARNLRGLGRIVFIALCILLVTSAASLAFILSNALLLTVPAPGGTLTEGIVGAPRFINPLLSISEADRDVTSLVYSGLLRATPAGEFIPDLAEGYEITEEGRVYTFTLKEGVTFHDGKAVTAEDVVYTVALAQDPLIKSPKRANWDGVEAEALDEKTVRFTLRSAYSPFIANATIGIVPKHLWQGVSAEEFPFSNLNTEAIGSGPYKVSYVARSASGIPSTYELAPFKNFALGTPFLSTITLRFYENENELTRALLRGEVAAASGITSVQSDPLPQGVEMRRAPLNRVFGVFFNQNQSEILRDLAVRRALSDAIDRQALVEEVLNGFGTPVTEPLPPGIAPAGGLEVSPEEDPALAARAYLEGRGWTYSEEEGALILKQGKSAPKILRFTISTADVPELREAATHVQNAWRAMGADVSVKIFEQGDLNQNVIRPRKYDALLFGEIIGRELDLFAFWHSSQRNDPGLNIALYANAAADEFLEEMRTAQDENERHDLYEKLRTEIMEDYPAVFLYAPDFTYLFPTKIKGMELTAISAPSERFLDVYRWHREVDRVWTFLTRFVGS